VVEQGRYGRDWTDDELDLIVADYFAMLGAELRGEPYVKAHHNRALMALTGRTHRSVEAKHMNISAVLAELGRPTIAGYKPYPNYQRSILQAIERFLLREPVLWSPTSSPTEPGEFHEDGALPFLEPAPSLGPAKERSADLQRLVRKFDAGERDFRNRSLGKAGEEVVMRFERTRLEAEERPDLASKVRWVAQEDGDGAGYDILSYDRLGRERLLEVKTTLGHRTTPFYLTRNECALAEERPDAFRLVRLYAFAQERRMFELEPPLSAAVQLSPLTYEARFN